MEYKVVMERYSTYSTNMQQQGDIERFQCTDGDRCGKLPIASLN